MRGAKYIPPMIMQCDSTAITVNGVRYEIAVDERPPREKIADGEYGEYEVYQYAAELVMEARRILGRVPSDTLAVIAEEANALLAARELPVIELVIEKDGNNIGILENGKHCGVRVEIKAHRPIFRAEIVRRHFEAIVGNLEYGSSVIWGQDYFASYSRARAGQVDQAIETWLFDKSTVDETLEDVSAQVEVNGVMVPQGVLVDLLQNQ